LALLASGFFSILVSARYLVNRTQYRAAGLEIARHEVEKMKMFVRADLWGTGATDPLNPTGTWSGWSPSVDDPRFSTRFCVSPGPGQSRQVTVQVKWDVPQI
jgi:hypothetical protein